MKHILYLLLTLSFILTACRHTTPEQKAQLSQADSLIEQHPDSAFSVLKKIHFYKDLSSPDCALYALLMSEALDKNDKAVESDSLIRIATDYFDNSEPQRAGYAWFYRARCENNRGNAQGQADALLKAQEFAAISNNYKLQGFVFGDKARMYQGQKQIDSMFYCNKQSLLFFQKAGDQRNTVICLLDMGVSCSLLGKLDSALNYCTKALHDALKLNEPMLSNSVMIQISYLYFQKNNFPLALKYGYLSMHTSDFYDYTKYINMGLIFSHLGNLDSARHYLKKCDNPHEMAPNYYRLWKELNEKEGNFKNALCYAEKLIAAKDSLNQRSLSGSFAGMEKKYNYQRFVTENRSLTLHNQYKNIFILLILLLMSIGVMLFLIFQNKQNIRLLEHQRLLTVQEELMGKQKQEKNDLLTHQLKIQQNTMQVMNRLKNNASKLIEEQKLLANFERKKQFLSAQEEAVSSLFRHMVETVDSRYDNISTRLVDNYPDLNQSDILICCFLLAGFDNITIASLLNILPLSYNLRRTYIRKKLHLPQHANLMGFLAKF